MQCDYGIWNLQTFAHLLRKNKPFTKKSEQKRNHFTLFAGMPSVQDVAMKILSTLCALMITTTAVFADAPVRHVVSFKFKKEASTDEVRRVEEAFAALKTKIPQIQSLEWGTNVSGEHLDKGFTHMWVLSFADAAALKVYLDHPEHQAFVKILKPSLEEAFVIDFQPR